MRTAFRIIAGIIGLPFVFVAGLALILMCFGLNAILSIPCLAIWLVFVMPAKLIWGCTIFALDNSTDGFKIVRDSFIAMADPTHGFRDVMIPICRDTCEMVADMYRDFKKLRAELKRAKACTRSVPL